MNIIIFIIISIGLYFIGTSFISSIYNPSIKAIKSRGENDGKGVIINDIAIKILPFVSLDKLKQSRLSSRLSNVGEGITAEFFIARSIAKGVLTGGVFAVFAVISPLFLVLAVIIGCYTFDMEDKKLKKQVENRKFAVEKELVAFTGTIRQSLNNSRNIIDIFESYRKICQGTLKKEIDISLNDMKSGNIENALRNLEKRVSSSKFSEVIRGLIGVIRGDDMRIYFEMLNMEFSKSAKEEVRKQLLKRPKELTPNMAGLFICLFVMVLIALGTMIMSEAGVLFSV